jgi:hypothetical protein
MKARPQKKDFTVQRVVRKRYTVPEVKLAPIKAPNVLPQTNKEMKARTHEPDPIITMLQNAIDTKLEQPGMTDIKLACAATISITTIRNIMNNKTRRPWHSTVKCLFSECGYDYLLKKRA